MLKVAGYVVVLTFIVLTSPGATAAEGDLEDLSLEDLLDLEIDIAARKARTLRDSPGVVTLVTRDEILALGARDLTDVILRVPGFAFGLDVEGVVGLGFRGNWGHEGKILLLIDGMELNETLYSTTQFGGHIPVDQIQQIEIIRGPGSAVYGGYAELAVINVVTRGAQDLKGGDVQIAYGQTGKTYGHRNVGLAWGKTFGGFRVSASGAIGQGTRSDRVFNDFSGGSYRMTNDSPIESAFVNVAAEWKGFSTRFVYDDYRVHSRISFTDVEPETFEVQFPTMMFEAKYDLALGTRLTITPRFAFREQEPWRTADKASSTYYDKSATRTNGGVSLSWLPIAKLDLLLGGEATLDQARLNDTELVGLQGQFGTSNSVSYQNVAVYSQALFDNPVANVALGARWEDHSKFGQSFVPRAALTRVFDRWNVKLLASSAFRAPGIENINLGTDIKPERTLVAEAELGYRLSSAVIVSGNVFDITVDDPIVYAYDPVTDTEGYFNFNRTGSRGAELDVRAVMARRRFSFNVSWYDARGKNDVALYAVDGNKGALLGLPQLKVVATGGTVVREGMSLDASAVLLGPRWGYLSGDGAGGGILEEADPALLFDLYLYQRDLLPRFDLGVGVYNVGNVGYAFIQPYNSGHAPVPSGSREYYLRMVYAF